MLYFFMGWNFLQTLSLLNRYWKILEFCFMPAIVQSSQTIKIITYMSYLRGAHWGHLSWSFLLSCPPHEVTSVSCSTFVKLSALHCSSLFECLKRQGVAWGHNASRYSINICWLKGVSVICGYTFNVSLVVLLFSRISRAHSYFPS